MENTREDYLIQKVLKKEATEKEKDELINIFLKAYNKMRLIVLRKKAEIMLYDLEKKLGKV